MLLEYPNVNDSHRRFLRFLNNSNVLFEKEESCSLFNENVLEKSDLIFCDFNDRKAALSLFNNILD